MFNITKEDRAKLLDYMSKRPYAEVYVLVAMLVGLKPIEEKKMKEKSEKLVM